MTDQPRRLILGNGEQYLLPVSKRKGGRTPEPPRSYEEARNLIRAGVLAAVKAFDALPANRRLPNEAVFCLRLHPDATAKSYDPTALFDDAPQLRKVGSRGYRESPQNVVPTERIRKLCEDGVDRVDGRLVFVQSSIAGFKRFLEQLNRPESRVPRTLQNELRRVERFDTLTPEERIMGFEANWTKGRVELVFHPTRVEPDRQLRFMFDLFDEAGVEHDRRQWRSYSSGPMFVSCVLTTQSLEVMRDVNPLRAAHPFAFAGLTDLRSVPTAPAPKPPASTTKSTIKVGMFDGGVDLTVPHLQGYVEEDVSLSIGTAADKISVAHGTAVAGAILYGELNGIAADTQLIPPPVSVVSFRVLPTSDSADIDLYESIDVIERAVPARKDIKVFNISFGPRGPILDDTISRFTYTLDALSVAHKVAFVVAVGNDGELADNYDRIQSPADVVNGLGVGAFSLAGETKVHASYSCKGPGRECGKIKPDVVAFGGCQNTPIHLVSTQHGSKLLAWGTSFAAPLVSRVAGQASESFDRSSSLLARALLVHGAIHPDGKPDNLFGHGIVPSNVNDILTCDDGTVTVVFQSDILPKHIISLPIPLPDAASAAGKLCFRWTVAGLPPVDPNHPFDYTCGCLEDTFYPHHRRFAFANPATKKTMKLDIKADKAEMDRLLGSGWKMSTFPVSDSGNKYKNEADRRALECKWEPVVRRELTKKAASVCRPFLTIQAIGRNTVPDRFDYVVVVTVCAPQYAGDLYTDIRTLYPALTPIRVRTEAEIRVQI